MPSIKDIKIPKQEKTTSKKSEGNFTKMAKNPMLQMAVQGMHIKYKLLIFLAFMFLLIGIGTFIKWIVQLSIWFPPTAIIFVLIIAGISFMFKKKKEK